jgi:ABC-type glycerol-3-phosphate transport system substrate-binding protein
MWSTKQFPWRLVGAGGQMFDEYNQPLFNSPEGKIAMEYWKRLYDDDLISPNAESTTVQQSRGDFCSGKVPMLIGEGPWMGGTCESMGADFTVAMAPGLCGEETCGNNVLVTLLGISVSSEDPEAVFEFIKYLTSDDFTVEFAQEWGSTFMNPAYFELPETQEDPVMGVVPQLLEDPDNFSHWAPIPKGEEMYQRFLEIWQQVLLEDLPIEEALEQMENVAIELTE